MLRSSLYDYSDAYILESVTIAIIEAEADDDAKETEKRDKEVIFKNYAPFTKWISEINNTQVSDAQENDVVMSMHILIEYIDNYSKTSGSLWQYYRDEPNATLTNSVSFKSKIKITGKTHADGKTKDVIIGVTSKHFRNFWRTPDMPLISCEINLILTWP